MRWPWVSRRRFDAIYACLVEAQRRDEWTYGDCLDYKRAAEIERAGRLRACDQIRFKDALIRRALALALPVFDGVRDVEVVAMEIG